MMRSATSGCDASRSASRCTPRSVSAPGVQPDVCGTHQRVELLSGTRATDFHVSAGIERHPERVAQPVGFRSSQRVELDPHRRGRSGDRVDLIRLAADAARLSRRPHVTEHDAVALQSPTERCAVGASAFHREQDQPVRDTSNPGNRSVDRRRRDRERFRSENLTGLGRDDRVSMRAGGCRLRRRGRNGGRRSCGLFSLGGHPGGMRRGGISLTSHATEVADNLLSSHCSVTPVLAARTDRSPTRRCGHECDEARPREPEPA